jgi:hypothetical protein
MGDVIHPVTEWTSERLPTSVKRAFRRLFIRPVTESTKKDR